MRLLGALLRCSADLGRFVLELARVIRPQQDDTPHRPVSEPYRPHH